MNKDKFPVIPEQVIEVDVNNKYLIVFDDYVTDEDKEEIADSIKDWLKKDNTPFCVLYGGTVLMIKKEDD